jgi:hypothetical protein
MTAIERRSRWLLAVYPRWYRQQRAEEILGTLMEATGPDRSWPSSKDAWALILAGLRVRAGLGQRQTVRANLSQALVFAAVLVLAAYSAGHLSLGVMELGHSAPLLVPTWLALVLGLATLAVMIGAWFGPGRIVAVAALATACLWAYQPSHNQLDLAIQPIAALGFIAIMALRRERPARWWLWLAVPWYLGFLLPELFPASHILHEVQNFGPLLILAATIAWCVLDLRPMLAVALWIAIVTGADFISFVFSRIFAHSGSRLGSLIAFWPWETATAVSTGLVIVAIWRLRTPGTALSTARAASTAG